MTAPEDLSRRTMLMKIGLFFNGIVGLVLAIPIVRYVLSPITRERGSAYESWLPLGSIGQFPAGQTRLATYTNPIVDPWDGKTGDIACWVRHIDGDKFQVFAINCAHLGCPVRWFPQSSLFMCPCHGGAYYEDGSRASGPPERGLFEYAYKIDAGKLFIKAGELPTPGSPTAKNMTGGDRSPCV
jgi:menaquinol-cytochrome c reductase iron-sulfur subunit